MRILFFARTIVVLTMVLICNSNGLKIKAELDTELTMLPIPGAAPPPPPKKERLH